MAEAVLIAVVALPLQEMPANGPATIQASTVLYLHYLLKSHVLCADNRYVMGGELCSFLNVVTILNMHE